MRKALLAIAALLGPFGHAAPANAQYLPPGELRGVGCYWFRGQHYCNRYCYLEVDGSYYCQRRLRDAGSQAPPPAIYLPPFRPPPPYDRHPPYRPHAK